MFYPGWWFWISLVLALLPSALYCLKVLDLGWSTPCMVRSFFVLISVDSNDKTVFSEIWWFKNYFDIYSCLKHGPGIKKRKLIRIPFALTSHLSQMVIWPLKLLPKCSFWIFLKWLFRNQVKSGYEWLFFCTEMLN